MRRVVELGAGAAVAAAVAIGLALPAHATQICNDLSDCSYKVDVYTGKGAQPKNAPWGTVTLTQGSGFVEVSVVLNGHTSFVSSPAGDAFMFNVAKKAKITNANIDGLNSGFTFDSKAGKAWGAGWWHYGMECTACTGGPNKDYKSLDFRITGISLAEFLSNSKGFSFAADLCFNYSLKRERCGRRGIAIAGFSIVPVPEPVSLSLLGVGLLAMGAFGRRWRGRSASAAA